MQSPLEQERLNYQPHLPSLLKQIDALDVIDGELTSALGDVEQLKTHFPKIFGQPIAHFKRGSSNPHPALRVGVVFSGGQAAGGHNVVTGLFDALKKLNASSRLFGFLGGPAGIIENAYRELTNDSLASYRNTGGFDLLGSGRVKIETSEQLEAVLKNMEALSLDGIVIVGGDDSNTNAAVMAEYFLTHGCHTKVIGVPKTIDGDLKNAWIETSFGFDTACKIYSEMIGNIARDALSAKKYTHFIKLMGRSASHITLECALQTQPNIALITEEISQKQMSLTQIAKNIAQAICERGKNYGVILIPEGLIEFVPEMKRLFRDLNRGELSKEAKETLELLPKESVDQLMMDRDPHGNVQVSHIATEKILIHMIRKKLEKGFSGKFNPVSHFLGYEGRSGFPSNFDADYCYALGFTACALIASGHTGYMSMIQKLNHPHEEWKPGGLPITAMMHIEERKGKLKPVIRKALVDLKGETFKKFAQEREQWVIEDHYRFPGPIQLFGPPHLCNQSTLTLQLEHHFVSR